MKGATLWRWLLPAILLAAHGLAAGSADVAAQVSAARKALEAAEHAIEQSNGKLQSAIDKVMRAERFEGPHWSELDQAVKDWSVSIEQQAAAMDGPARTLVRLAPQHSMPGGSLQLQAPAFKPLLKQMEGIARDFQAAVDRAEQMKRRYQQVQAQVQQDMAGATRDKLTETVTDYAWNKAGDLLGVPTDAAGVIALLGGPVTVGVQAGIGVAQQAWGLYHHWQEMASSQRVLDSTQKQLAFIDEFISRTQANRASAQQGVALLERFMGQREATLAKFHGVRNGWVGAAQQGVSEATREAVQQFDAQLERPEPGMGVHGLWPNVAGSVIPASDYEAPAEAILRELRSAALAAVDGGSPLLFHEIVAGHLDRLGRPLATATERRNQAHTAYNEAISAYVGAYQEAVRAHSEAWRACQGHVPCLDAADARFLAVVNAAIAACHAPAAAAHAAIREQVRLQQVVNLVSAGAQTLQETIRLAAYGQRQVLWMRWGQHQAAQSEAAQDLSPSLAQVPSAWQLAGFEQMAGRVQELVAEELRSGAEPAAVRDKLMEHAHQIRRTGQVAAVAIVEYRKGLTALRNVTGAAERDLLPFITKYGPLLRYEGPLPDYTQASIDEFVAVQTRHVQDSFAVMEAEHVAAASRYGYETAARRIESGLAELDDWVQRLDTFRWRLATSQGRLDAFSQAMTGQPAYAQRQPPLRQQALGETRGGAWAGLTQSLVQLLAAEDMQSTLRLMMPLLSPPFDGLAPRQMLTYAQSALHALTQSRMRLYLNVHGQGGFHPVPPGDMEKLQAAWRLLDPLYDQYEALAAAERARLEGWQALVPDESRLHQSYQAIPPALAPLVNYPYQRHVQASGALRDYLQIRLQAVQPVAPAQRAELKAWIEGYEVARIDWQRRIAEAEARAAAERERAEQERLRLEAEARTQQAGAQARLQAVHSLYQEFAEAYRERSLGRLTRMMTPDWRASDGADLSDLEDNLGNSFRVFDRVQFSVENLLIEPLGADRFKVSYSVTIQGRIFQMDREHRETSNVEDTVVIGSDGRARIQATRGGRLWLQ